jgi:heat shock protein HslJ
MVLAACAEPGEPAASDPTEDAWELRSGTLGGEPIPMVDGHPITLTFTEDGAGGTAACNGYGGSYTVSGEGITFSELGQTEMACFPEETMESEQQYLMALSRVETFSLTEDSLTLAGESVELDFVALPPVPTSDMTGTVWVLDGLVQGEAVSSVSGEQATLELFSDESMLGSTGCRTLSGNYIISGAEVILTDFRAEGECATELQEQDSRIITVLEGGFRVEIEGDTMTIATAGDEELIYKAES